MLNPDYKEFLQLLNENDGRYLEVDGYAVAFHGYPRCTKALDIWVQLDDRNAARVVEVLERFEF
jgi:hypothetical protein